jgi:septum formation topological specificity factor MinE
VNYYVVVQYVNIQKQSLYFMLVCNNDTIDILVVNYVLRAAQILSLRVIIL